MRGSPRSRADGWDRRGPGDQRPAVAAECRGGPVHGRGLEGVEGRPDGGGSQALERRAPGAGREPDGPAGRRPAGVAGRGLEPGAVVRLLGVGRRRRRGFERAGAVRVCPRPAGGDHRRAGGRARSVRRDVRRGGRSTGPGRARPIGRSSTSRRRRPWPGSTTPPPSGACSGPSGNSERSRPKGSPSRPRRGPTRRRPGRRRRCWVRFCPRSERPIPERRGGRRTWQKR